MGRGKPRLGSHLTALVLVRNGGKDEDKAN